jgi:hypothetical protein
MIFSHFIRPLARGEPAAEAAPGGPAATTPAGAGYVLERARTKKETIMRARARPDFCPLRGASWGWPRKKRGEGEGWRPACLAGRSLAGRRLSLRSFLQVVGGSLQPSLLPGPS